jgi:hypothetical protein
MKDSFALIKDNFALTALYKIKYLLITYKTI